MFYLFMADGTEEVEAIATLDVMRRAGIEVKTAGVGSDVICGSHGIKITCDMAACETVLEDSLEGVVIPGGMPGTVNLENDKFVIDAVKYCADNSKLLCAICAAPSVFGHLGLLEGKKAVCFPGFEQELKGCEVAQSFVCTDGNIITAKGMGSAVDFGLEIVAAVCGRQKSDALRGTLQCPKA